ncbi:hypothetical protein GCM10007938_42510 [Vibrio zhanjiangensis]|uniref:Integrase n=1 Tax=Vibrio zhanjiangensis TaxID=1046128 RepID=A0ABQ6F5E5_9VIBR|nr:hypothetical protein [Vibrio zhanjiangensis]GLT20466.1 hypothetical protein GCM10007938_42510 [Vibrio zhanjiangensis]
MSKHSYYRNKKEEQTAKKQAAVRRKIETWRECQEVGLNPLKDLQWIR